MRLREYHASLATQYRICGQKFRSLNILEALYLSPPLQDCHGLHYNRCETSEDEEKEADWAQRMFVGVANETASTCNSL